MNNIVVSIFLILSFSCFSCSRETNEINYQGEKIKLSRSYNDYDEYKNDPINIDPSEIERVQQLVINAPIARSFQNRLQASTAIGQIAFPGYGSGGFVAQQQTDGSVLMGFSVEIPNAEKERYFVFLENNGECTLIDDFVFSDAIGLINSVVLRGDNLIFSSIEGKEILVRSYLGKK